MENIDWKSTPGACSMIDEYEDLEPIGCGTYGIVYKARRKQDKTKIVALKEVRMEKEKDGLPITTVREIKLLSRLQHPNLVCLQEVAVGTLGNQFFLVFDYADHDLSELIDSKVAQQTKPFTIPHIKNLLAQILQAIDYLHSHWVIHRDVKMSNLLYVDSTGQLKLADLGLARTFSNMQAEELTPEVVTLWYRAPELLFDSYQYGPAVDMWSVGCIFGELVLGKPLLPGHSVPEQIKFTQQLLGTPSDIVWPGHDHLPGYVKPTVTYPPSLVSIFKHRLDNNGLDLLVKLLRYDPAKRITAQEALQHPFFSSEPLPTPPHKMPNYSDIRRNPPKSMSAHSTPPPKGK